MRLFICLLFVLVSLISIPSSLSSPFSTIAISRVDSDNLTVVCALVTSSPSSKRSDLTCTTLPIRYNKTYSSSTSYTGTSFTQYSAVATGDDFLCGIISSNLTSMRWWSFGGGYNPLDGEVVYKGPLLEAISAGDSHVCGLTSETQQTECWEWDDMAVPDDVIFTSIAVGKDFLCGIRKYCGEIKCFGDDKGIVGNEPIGNFTVLAAGSTHACAVSASGNLTCWGHGAPKLDNMPADLISLSLGTNRTCILTSNGTVKCWGKGVKPPKGVAGMEFVSVEAKGDSICGVLMSNFSLICWGNENFESNNLVYSQVVPGACAPEGSCTCGMVGDSANLCSSSGYVICKPCKISLIATPNHVNITPPLPSPPPLTEKRSKVLYMVIGIVGTAFAISMVILIFVFHGIIQKRKQKNNFDPSVLNQGRVNNVMLPITLTGKAGLGCTEFSLRTLCRATDNFAEGNLIGSGGFGKVYWGVLPDGRQAAVKRAHRRRRRHAETAFLSELALLSRVNHKNLVRLFGFSEERGERLLVVEYMANGTLQQHLHEPPTSSDPSPLFTSWSTRIRIALDAARGIEYLHSYAVPGIIHRDIKPSNILLDSNWIAKVSDFGISMTRASGEASAAGTVGYMDPEYYRCQELTEKSDVYSFGVVLLQILTGMKAVVKTDDNDEEPCHIAEYVVPRVENNDIDSLVDERVPIRDAGEKTAINRVMKLAVQCVRARGRGRPTMRDIVSGLEWALSLCPEEEEEGVEEDDEDMVDVVVEVEESISSSSAYELEWGFSRQTDQHRMSLQLESLTRH
ncbi:hypothetical protein LUZ60_015925 [Juncus effusus]|nr:hypothetical protein LUZ60_015925 [Juncus effusus]